MAPKGRGDPFNLVRACLGRRAEDPAFAQRPAFSFIDGTHVREWTYAEVWSEVTRIARGLLARGLQPGDHVLVRLPHSPEYAFTFFGSVLAGLVPIPASPMLTREEAAFLAEDGAARAVIAGPELRIEGFAGLELLPDELARLDGPGPLPDTYAEDVAYLIYTSGTSSKPKGVLHAHRVIRAREVMVGPAWEDFGPDDRVLHAGTMNWSYTLGVGLMDPWTAGAHAMLIASPPDPSTLPALLAEHRVSVFVAVPTLYRQMLKYGAPEAAGLAALRHCLCAGEALSPAIAEEWRSRVGTEMYESLGMTEVSTFISSGPGVPVRPGSPGKPQPGRRVVALPEDGGEQPLPPNEVGLLAVHRSDPGLMLGYWRRPEEEAAVFRGEWFVGGDLAALDEDGYVWFHGRADDVIKSFGYRLSPVEIEAGLSSLPGVAEVAVLGVPAGDDKTLVTACVVPQPGAEVSEERLRAHAEEHLAAYKRPHQYRIVESLPHTPNGKLLRRVLLEELRR